MFENPNRLAKMKIVDYKISGFRVPMKSTKNDPYMLPSTGLSAPNALMIVCVIVNAASPNFHFY